MDEIHDPERSAGPESGLAGEQPALAHWVKTVDVLLRRQTEYHALLVKPFGKRELDENAVHVAIGVQLVDDREQLGFRRGGRQLARERAEADLGARLELGADVDLRRGVFADKHGGEPGLDSV